MAVAPARDADWCSGLGGSGVISGINTSEKYQFEPVAEMHFLPGIHWYTAVMQKLPSLFPVIGCHAVILAFCFANAPVNAQDAQDKAAEPAAEKTYPRVDTKDEVALRENLGKKVTVFGLIKRTRNWDGGANFLNFDGGKFMLICFESEYPNFPDGLPAATLKEKNVEVTGYINEYKGKLQIKLTHPDQIKIIEPVKDAAATEKNSDKDTEKRKAEEPAAKPEKVDPRKYFC